MKKGEIFFIKYNNNITHDIWKEIKDKFNSMGLTQRDHCNCGLDLNSFKDHYYIRTACESEMYDDIKTIQSIEKMALHRAQI